MKKNNREIGFWSRIFIFYPEFRIQNSFAASLTHIQIVFHPSQTTSVYFIIHTVYHFWFVYHFVKTAKIDDFKSFRKKAQLIESNPTISQIKLVL